MSASAPNAKRSFDSNAVDLTEEEAKAEAARRNAVEIAAGHKSVDWFPCRNPLAMLKDMGFDV
jgi:hypothetical protein